MSAADDERTTAHPGDAGLRRLVALARETLVVSDTIDERAVQSARRGRGARPLRLRRPVVAALAVGAAAIVATPVAWQMARRPGPLTFEVVHGTVAASGEIRPAGADTRIQFSDGSEVVLGPEAGTEVRDLAADGGRIVLSHGRVRAYFVPRPKARWQVAAGPYLVQVTGTAFDVQWSGGNQVFELWLRKGSVRVSGPLLPDGVIVKAGQHLSARAGDDRFLLENEGASINEAAPEAPRIDAPKIEAPAAPAPATPSSPAPPAAPSWNRRLARGDFEAIVADAERRGIEAVLGRGARTEVAALADAARYTRRPRLARRALLAERGRFADSAEGREAAFFLGNLAEDDADAPAASRWYAQYLRDDPAGTYAAQALGRKLLLDEQHAPDAARADAQDYLRRYPNGAYADVARRILKQ